MMMMIFLLLHSCTLWIEISKHVRHSILTYFFIVDFLDDFSPLLLGSDPIICPLLTTTQQHHNLFFPFPCANIYSPTKRKIIHHFAPQGRREMEGRTMKAFSHALRSDELKGAQQTSLFQRQWPSKKLFLTSRSHTHQRWYFQHLSLPITTTLFVVSLQIIIFHLTAGNFIQN